MHKLVDSLDEEPRLPTMELFDCSPVSSTQISPSEFPIDSSESAKRAFFLMQVISCRIRGQLENFRTRCKIGHFGPSLQQIDTSLLVDQANIKLLTCTYVYLAGLENSDKGNASSVVQFLSETMMASDALYAEPPSSELLRRFVSKSRNKLIKDTVLQLTALPALTVQDLDAWLTLKQMLNSDQQFRREVWIESLKAPVTSLRSHLLLFA